MFDDQNNNNQSEPFTLKTENKNESYLILKITLTIILVLSLTLVPIFFIYHTNDELNFLVVSDVHEDYDILDKLVKKLSNKKFEYVLFLGDFLDPLGTHKENKTDEDLKKVEKIVKKLEEIAPVLYIGGNHDPLRMFTDEKPIETDLDKSKNLHKNFQKIKDDLYIVGIGGSTPILYNSQYSILEKPFESLDFNNNFSNGFPYDDPNYNKSDLQLNETLQEILSKFSDVNTSIILMSHAGPLYSYTSVQNLTEEYPIGYLGSLNLFNSFVLNEKIFLNVHGHTHPSRGRYNYYEDKTILNPGALATSYYATMIINKKDGKYNVKTTFEDLD